jgi:hypothetical protein
MAPEMSAINATRSYLILPQINKIKAVDISKKTMD